MTQTSAFTRNGLGAKALTIALTAGVVLLVLPYATGLIGAAILYVVAVPIFRRLDPSRRRHSAAFLIVFLLFVALVLPGVWLFAELAAQIPEAVRSLQQSATIQRLMAMRIGDVNLGGHLQDASTAIVAWSSRQTMSAITGIVYATLNLIVALFGTYYLLLSGDALWERFKEALPFCPTTSELLRIRFHRVTEAMLLGVVLTCAAQGALVGIAFWLIGLPHPLLWGAVTAVVSILPMFGSGIVWFPAVLILIAQHRYPQAGLLGALGVVLISNIDNALRLIVYRRVSQIHPMVTLVGAFAGVRAFGFVGLLIGPLVLSYVIELLRIYRANAAPLEATA